MISLAALHIPLIFYCNRSYLCAGLTRAPSCRHALLVLQNVVYVKQLTRNPKGLLQVQCRKHKPPQILLITIKTEQPWKYKIMYQICTFVVVVLCFSQWYTTWASYQHKHCVWCLYSHVSRWNCLRLKMCLSFVQALITIVYLWHMSTQPFNWNHSSTASLTCLD